jgi:GTP:adenosylcobinamide-phosphate guanylyltransferase
LGVPAIVTAGDSRAAKAVYGKSKVYLEVDGLALVAHVVRTLQSCPEIDAVWVVGDPGRLDAALSSKPLQDSLTKPLYIVEQHRDLISNCWETYRRILTGDVAEGRDPVGDDLDQEVLYLSGDIPLATPQELSSFVQHAQSLDVDYALGLCPAESLDVFRPEYQGQAGITVAYFNTCDGRFRQNNLHYAKLLQHVQPGSSIGLVPGRRHQNRGALRVYAHGGGRGSQRPSPACTFVGPLCDPRSQPHDDLENSRHAFRFGGHREWGLRSRRGHRGGVRRDL